MTGLRVTAKSVIFPVITFLALVAAPLVLIRLVPAEAVGLMHEVVDVDLPGMVMVAAGVGVVLAVLSFFKNAWEEWSWVYLGSSLASTGGSLFLFLYMLGLGDPGCLGRITRTLEAAPLMELRGGVIVDLRFFAFLLILIAAIAVAKTLLAFKAARKSRLEPQPVPIPPSPESPIG